MSDFRILRRYLYSFILMLFLFPVTDVNADEWAEIKNAARNIKSIRADFVQEKYMKILSKPLVSRGRFFFKSPGSLRWEYLTPVRSVLLMHKGNIQSFSQDIDGKLVSDSRSKLQAMHIVMQEISEWLKGNFRNNPDFETTLFGSGKSIIKLVPREKAMAKIISRIEIVISRKEGIINTVKICESSDSCTLIEFKNVKHNSGIDESVFREL